MGLMHCSFMSEVLMRECSMNVFVPEKPHSDGKPGFPVVYLLHGRSDNYSAYVDHGVCALCKKYEFIVVMPDGARSFYSNMKCGQRYWDFISEELPRLVQTMFPIRQDRASTFAAGLSMGGYGALKLGLRCPERFGRIGAMSSVADISWVGRPGGGMSDEEVASIYGSRSGMTGTDDDLFTWLEKPAPACGRPLLKMSCGDADFLINDNREFVKRAQSAGWCVDYSETADIGHCWEFWMAQLPGIFEFFSK